MRPPWSAPLSCDASWRPAPPRAPRWSWSATPTSWPRSRPAAACSSSSARTCPGRSAFLRCGGCATPPSATPRWRCAAARGNRLRKAIGWYRNHDRLHTGDAIAMAADATTAYLAARAEGKDAAILCDRWEIADAINQRLHDHYRHPDPDCAAGARSAGPRRRSHPEPPQRRHHHRRARHPPPPR